MINDIATESPGGLTSIGAGMDLAAGEYATGGKPSANACSFVLLSDGQENTAPYWADIRNNVTQHGCAIHTIALGAEANELLMQQIAASVPGGSYDYATVGGSVPLTIPEATDPDTIANPASTTTGWANGLSRIYDYKAAQIADRQRVQTFVQENRDQKSSSYTFFVDDSTDQLVLSIAWQTRSTGHSVKLLRPDGTAVASGARRLAPTATNEVWVVDRPAPGEWRLIVENLFQPYIVSPTLRSNYKLYLFIGSPIDQRSQGVRVPIQAAFVGNGKPIINAAVIAKITSPSGTLFTLTLRDDGNSGDGNRNDGIYGGFFTTTNGADRVTQDGKEDSAPAVIGSYQVNLTASRGKIRREAQGSFAITAGVDDDGDRIPDAWESANGLNPKNSDDAKSDVDRDGLDALCEYRLGSDPRNADSDGGGESDGSEAPECKPVRNLLDGSDDQRARLSALWVKPELNEQGRPAIHLEFGTPEQGSLRGITIFRRPVDSDGKLLGDWVQLGITSSPSFEDLDVVPGTYYIYQAVPSVNGTSGEVFGPTLASSPVTASNDPYAPSGTILINNGAARTNSTTVTLALTADDSGGEHDGEQTVAPVPGSPVSKLEMRLSNTPNFDGKTWRPFTTEVSGWSLGSPTDGQTVVVYLQLRDEAGNVAESGFGMYDSIVFQSTPTTPTPTASPTATGTVTVTPTATPTETATPTPTTTPTPSLTISQVSPGAGFNDSAIELTVNGADFDASSVVLLRTSSDSSNSSRMADAVVNTTDTELATTFVSASQLLAVIPSGQSPATYDVIVSNADGDEATLEEAFKVVERRQDGTTDYDDLFSSDDQLWVDPLPVRVGEQVSLGLLLQRKGGEEELSGVEVAFHTGAITGTSLGTVTIPFLATNAEPESTIPLTTIFTSTGEVTIYAIIDPNNAVTEGDETNNVYQRTILVEAAASAGADITKPIVSRVDINGGSTMSTTSREIIVGVEATDPTSSTAPTETVSGVRHAHMIEYVYLSGIGSWVPVAQSGWQVFGSSPQSYPWTLTPQPGARYLQVRARDAAGNVSTGQMRRLLNYTPTSDSITQGQTRIYRYEVAAGQALQVNLEVVSGDADLYVWSSNSVLSHSHNSGSDPEVVSITAAQITPGIYQVEVYGYTAAVYTISATIGGVPAALPTRWYGGISQTAKTLPTAPLIAVNSSPNQQAGSVPSVPAPVVLNNKVFIPLVAK